MYWNLQSHFWIIGHFILVVLQQNFRNLCEFFIRFPNNFHCLKIFAYVKEADCEAMNWIALAGGSVRWRDLLLKFPVTQKVTCFFNYLVTIYFWRTSEPHRVPRSRIIIRRIINVCGIKLALFTNSVFTFIMQTNCCFKLKWEFSIDTHLILCALCRKLMNKTLDREVIWGQ
jgi:hypothetical protein